jgi:hypothetical protein
MANEPADPQKPQYDRSDSLDCEDIYLDMDIESENPIPKRPMSPKLRAELLRLRALYYPNLPPLPEEPPASDTQDAGS